MGKLVAKQQCPKCLDSGHDNLAVYEDGSAYCFGCTHTVKTTISTPTIAEDTSTTTNFVSGIVEDLSLRGIPKYICEFFDYRVGTYTGYIGGQHVRDVQVQIANYYTPDLKLTHQKLRTPDKKMVIRGTPQHYLYGQWKYNPSNKLFVVVVEGEIDALTVATVQGKEYPVVSIPQGAPSARKYLQENLEWLQKFKYVILGFDSDEAGQESARACVDLFEPGKVRIAKWTKKDPNEMLLAGLGADIKNCLWNAEEVRPDKVCTSLDLLSRLLERPTYGTPWPWEEMTKCSLGMREQQLIVIGAAPGIGKTEMIKDMVLDAVTKKGIKAGIFSFEQDAADTLRRLVGGMLNIPLHLPGTWWDEKVIAQKAKEIQNKVFLYDNWGGAKADDLAPKMRYLAKAYGAKLFVIDHLTAIAARMEGDERRGIEKVMEQLASLSRELRCCIVLVSHLSRDKKQGAGQEDSWGAGRKPAMENFKGSGAIEAWADVVFGLSRNADSDDLDEKRVLLVQCLKARLDGSKRGYTFTLQYNDATGKLEEPYV